MINVSKRSGLLFSKKDSKDISIAPFLESIFWILLSLKLTNLKSLSLYGLASTVIFFPFLSSNWRESEFKFLNKIALSWSSLRFDKSLPSGGRDIKHSDAWEIGTGVNYSINELYSMFKEKFDTESESIPDQRGNYRETLRVNDDLINLLNWKPKDRLREYIANLNYK